MFGVALSGQETIELRRWITGPERTSRGRRRGLAARLSDVASYDDAGARAISRSGGRRTRSLPSDGWLQRLAENAALRGDRSSCSPPCAASSMPATTAGPGDAGYGIETEAAGPARRR
jgi:ATP-dependent DNA helicase DinG